MTVNNVLWFRHGLRLHDNPSLLEALKSCNNEKARFYPIFIFDGESAGTGHVGYNRMRFLIESLADLDRQFKLRGGPGLFIFRGNPVQIFRMLHDTLKINKICYEQDCEPIWQRRDREVESMCRELHIQNFELISHTLWNPRDIIEANGGYAPLTFQMMLHTVNVLGLPPRPVNEGVDFSDIIFGNIPSHLATKLGLMAGIPCPEDFFVYKENENLKPMCQYRGGEQGALEQLSARLKVEEQAFLSGTYLPNQANVDLLSAPMSLSPALRFGCLSVRKFYYAIHDKLAEVRSNSTTFLPSGHFVTGQLIWREYFYTMSVENINYAQMKHNPICLDIPWGEPKASEVSKWKDGQTGFPIIDAAMRQLLAEGWLHHILRNLVATFLTRTGMWLSWEIGVEHFLKYLLDADWSVCAGNWMWVSSSAFEKLLDSSKCSIIAMGQRLDPNGAYIRRYIPQLRNFPLKYIHQPWMAPDDVQEQHDCIIGRDYPSPMLDLKQASLHNCQKMRNIRESLIEAKPHVRPSNDDEIRKLFWIADNTAIKCN